jgi:hypothetical protein
MPFESISEEQREAFISSLKAGQYNLLLGAGASMDSSNGKEQLPSGTKLREDLAAAKNANPSQPLQKIFSLLDAKEVEQHVTKRFSNCTAGPTYLLLSSFVWKRAFTFNIDDAMASAYEGGKGKQSILSYNFDDEYEDDRTLEELPLITQRQTERLILLIDEAKSSWKRDKEVSEAFGLLEAAFKG